MPAKQDLQGVWNVVQKDLGSDPGRIEDKDLQAILTGVLSAIHGISALRTRRGKQGVPTGAARRSASGPFGSYTDIVQT